MNLFLDTNAIVKLYHMELGTENLLKFLYTYINYLIITISDITKIEFHSTFLKRVRNKEIDIDRVKKIFDSFELDINMFNVIEVDYIIKSYAIKLLDFTADKKALRTLDAIQLSTALISHQIFKIDCFVCSDKKLLNVAEKYFTVFNPEQPD